MGSSCGKSRADVGNNGEPSENIIAANGAHWMEIRYKRPKPESIPAVVLGLVALIMLKTTSAFLFASIMTNTIVIGATVTAIFLDWGKYCRAIPVMQDYMIVFVVLLAVTTILAFQTYPRVVRYLDRTSDAAKARIEKVQSKLSYQMEKKLVMQLLSGHPDLMTYLEKIVEAFYFSILSAPAEEVKEDEEIEAEDTEGTGLLSLYKYTRHRKHRKDENYLNLVNFSLDITESWTYFAYLMTEVLVSGWWMLSVVLTPIGLDDSIKDCQSDFCNQNFMLTELYVLNYLFLIMFVLTFVRIGFIKMGILGRTLFGMRLLRYGCVAIDSILDDIHKHNLDVCCWAFDSFYYRNPNFPALIACYQHELPDWEPPDVEKGDETNRSLWLNGNSLSPQEMQKAIGMLSSHQSILKGFYTTSPATNTDSDEENKGEDSAKDD